MNLYSFTSFLVLSSFRLATTEISWMNERRRNVFLAMGKMSIKKVSIFNERKARHAWHWRRLFRVTFVIHSPKNILFLTTKIVRFFVVSFVLFWFLRDSYRHSSALWFTFFIVLASAKRNRDLLSFIKKQNIKWPFVGISFGIICACVYHFNFFPRWLINGIFFLSLFIAVFVLFIDFICCSWIA